MGHFIGSISFSDPNAIGGSATNPNAPAVNGTHTGGGVGVSGTAGGGANAIGVRGSSDTGDGMQGITSSNQKSGIFGRNDSTGNASAPAGSGVFGLTMVNGGVGVFGLNNSGKSGRGVQGNGPEAGVGGFSDGPDGIGVLAQSPNIALKCQGGKLAGRFEGDVQVTGDICLVKADCAEDFDIAGSESVEPGTVMVLGPKGAVLPSEQPYDRKVAGVVAGAGDYEPAIILDRSHSDKTRIPISLVGKAFCKVDSQYGSIELGDLLTTSPTAGHAMKASDRDRAFGAVIGKALRPFSSGKGLIPILIALQ